MNLRINGTEREVAGGSSALLVYALRDELGMTGTKIGCAAGFCGSCTVLVDGVATRACITPLAAASWRSQLSRLPPIPCRKRHSLRPGPPAVVRASRGIS